MFVYVQTHKKLASHRNKHYTKNQGFPDLRFGENPPIRSIADPIFGIEPDLTPDLDLYQNFSKSRIAPGELFVGGPDASVQHHGACIGIKTSINIVKQINYSCNL